MRNLDAEQIALGRSALEQAYLPSVKVFADVVVDDARDARDRLTPVLEDTGITLSPRQDAAALKEARDALAGKTGRAFDRAYVTLVAATCTRAIDSVQGELSGAELPQVQAWAAAILPALRHQLELARELESRLGS